MHVAPEDKWCSFQRTKKPRCTISLCEVPIEETQKHEAFLSRKTKHIQTKHKLQIDIRKAPIEEQQMRMTFRSSANRTQINQETIFFVRYKSEIVKFSLQRPRSKVLSFHGKH